MFEPHDLYNKVRERFERQCREEDLAFVARAYATDKINAMTNDEFLKALSFALAELDN